MTENKKVKIGNFSAGPYEKLLVIAGPCQIESLDHALEIASELKSILSKYPVNFLYKSSYDKANRTSIKGRRGVGMEKGLEILSQVKKRLNIPVLTDVHSIEEAEQSGKIVDVVQIPAFLCRQTDLLQAAGRTSSAVNIKKGQFMHPSDMCFAAEKVSSSGNNNIMLCERGSCFGYRDLVVDMRSLVMLREIGYPIIFDGTHSVQNMGGQDGISGGSRQFIAPLVRAATAVGIDGLFLECHEDPKRAPSDSACMLPIAVLEPLLDSVCSIRESLPD